MPSAVVEEREFVPAGDSGTFIAEYNLEHWSENLTHVTRRQREVRVRPAAVRNFVVVVHGAEGVIVPHIAKEQEYLWVTSRETEGRVDAFIAEAPSFTARGPDREGALNNLLMSLASPSRTHELSASSTSGRLKRFVEALLRVSPLRESPRGPEVDSRRELAVPHRQAEPGAVNLEELQGQARKLAKSLAMAPVDVSIDADISEDGTRIGVVRLEYAAGARVAAEEYRSFMKAWVREVPLASRRHIRVLFATSAAGAAPESV